MIFITVKFTIKPERADEWLDTVADFTAATRAEQGNKFFEWSRSVEEPNVFYLVEAFDDGAAEAHVGSEHFEKAMEDMRPLVAKTPQIISQELEGKDGWDRMGELEVD